MKLWEAILPTIRRALWIVPTILLVAPVSAFADQLEDKLNQQYKEHIYMLRQPMTAPTQQYDPHGNSPTASAIGPWTVYGRMQIKKIRVERFQLVVEGQRIGMKFDSETMAMVPTKLGDQVSLEISLDRPLESPDQVRAIFSNIFAFTREDFLATAPELWRSYLMDHLATYADDGEQITFSRSTPSSEKQRKELPPDVVHVGNGVSAPVPKFQPDPDYSKAAKIANFRGTDIFDVIVDKTGKARNICVVRPLGLGLDENAADRISSWKFIPAKRDSEPVSVDIRIEVTFNLSH